jgi:sulfate adenylyltransferase subunit 1 (EFTu-like GTPase family)
MEHFELDDRPGSARLDVQRVIRPAGSDFRGIAGRLAGASLAVGDVVTVQPAGIAVTVAALHRFGRPIDVALPGQAITASFDTDVDVARGDVLISGQARSTEQLTGHLCWMIERPLRAGDRLWFKHGTRIGRAVVERIEHRHDLHSLQPVPADELALNDLGVVHLTLSEPVVAEPYRHSRDAGRMILIDEATNTTAGALMVTGLGVPA